MGGGNLKELRLYLIQSRRKAKREAFAEQQALVQQQQQGTQQMEQMRAQKEMQTKQLDVQGAIAIENNKHQNDLELYRMKLNAEYVAELKKESEREYTQVNAWR